MANSPIQVEVPHTTGDSGNNVLYDTSVSDRIFGLGGNDTVVANNYTNPTLNPDYSYDEFDGGSGYDTVDYSNVSKATGYNAVYVHVDLASGLASRYISGNESNRDYLVSFENVIGSNFHDYIYGNSGANQLEGGAGSDRIYGRAGHDDLFGQDGVDFLYGENGNDQLYGGLGNDFLYGNNDHDDLYGQEGNDSLSGGAGNDLLEGGTGRDTLQGHSGNDTLNGGHGDDVINGHQGSDRINGGRGADEINGGSGSDTIVHTGGTSVSVNLELGMSINVFGDDTLVSIENIQGGSGNDVLIGDSDANTIVGGAGNDYVNGLQGNDFLYGSTGNDQVFGADGNDWLFGENNEDLLRGNDGEDRLYGGNHDDRLEGGAGNDILRGDAGNDLIIGGAGVDNVKGGAGADVFRWEHLHYGQDAVMDFVVGVDKLSFSNDFFAFSPGPGSDYVGLLSAVAMPGLPNSSILMANTQFYGWESIGFFHNVHANSLNAGIISGNIFAVQVNEGVLPDDGGFVFA